MNTIAQADFAYVGSGSVARSGPNFARPATISSEATDAVLMTAIARGDRHALEVLYGRHHLRVYRFILRLAGDPTLAEDVVSDVFFAVWRNADGFKAQAEVSTWLLAIARYKVLTALRRRTTEPLDDEKVAMIADSAPGPEQSVQNKDRSSLLQACLSKLSPVQREIVDLVYYHEKSVDEVAQITGAPASTVKTRMFYARQRIRALLEEAGCDNIH
jgi:RNA polymerase sigma-70 factor (ECF subfamily)